MMDVVACMLASATVTSNAYINPASPRHAGSKEVYTHKSNSAKTVSGKPRISSPPPAIPGANPTCTTHPIQRLLSRRSGARTPLLRMPAQWNWHRRDRNTRRLRRQRSMGASPSTMVPSTTYTGSTSGRSTSICCWQPVMMQQKDDGKSGNGSASLHGSKVRRPRTGGRG